MLIALGWASLVWAQTSPPGQAPPEFSIKKIPFFQASLLEPKAMPLTEEGIAFQRSKASKGTRRYRPIGQAGFGPDKKLYLTFPSLHTIISTSAPQWGLSYMGPKRNGGSGEIIKDPETLHFVDGNLYLGNHKNAMVLAIKPDGSFLNAFDAVRPGSVPGPDDRFIVTESKDPNRFHRVDSRKKSEHTYLLRDAPAKTPEGKRLIFDVKPDWQLIALRKNAGWLYHFDKLGNHLRQISIDTTALTGLGPELDAHAVRHDDGLYWILASHLKPASAPQSLLFAIDEKGEVKHLWNTPFYADGFDISDDHILLYTTITGSAQTYRRP